MPRKPTLWVCDIAHKCGFTFQCKHAAPHRKKSSCKTRCRRKLGTYKCVAVTPCAKCGGKGYHIKRKKEAKKP